MILPNYVEGNSKTGCSRKFSLPENDFKTYSAKLLMPTKMWNWDLKKSLSNWMACDHTHTCPHMPVFI